MRFSIAKLEVHSWDHRALKNFVCALDWHRKGNKNPLAFETLVSSLLLLIVYLEESLWSLFNG